jgi:acyl carrier protein
MNLEVRTFLEKTLDAMNYDIDGLTDETPLGEAGLDLESLGMAELAMRIEEKYGTTFPDEESERLVGMNFGQFVTWIGDIVASPATGAPA